MKPLNIPTLAVAAGSLMCSVAAFAGDDKMQKWDTNSDGMISQAEYMSGVSQKFQKMDTDGDGSVTAAQMSAAHDQMRPGDSSATAGTTGATAPSGTTASGSATMSANDMFRSMDSNNDGALTAEEHQAAMRDKFSKMDTNGDGNLSEAELQSAKGGMSGDRSY
jgi:Ca2+-binding EF-hand superfamily protein